MGPDCSQVRPEVQCGAKVLLEQVVAGKKNNEAIDVRTNRGFLRRSIGAGTNQAVRRPA